QLIPVEEVYVEALQVKHPIINWEVHTKGQRSYWKIIRLGGSSASYQFFMDLLKHLDREDLNQLWTLVKETVNIRPATNDKEMEIWVELKRLEQMLLAMKDEAESNLNNEENDFMLDTSYGEETMEELTATLMLMARIQPTDGNAETVPSYDAKAISKVNASSKVHKQVSHMKCKTIQTFNDDQIHFNIIFDYPYVENNGSTSQHDSNAHDEYHEIQMLTYNVQKEAENQKRLNNELKKRKYCYKKELEMCKDRVKMFE
nr:hypothetical protein [Tanacetum cinerariifolium]